MYLDVVILTFVAATALWGLVGLFACWRIGRHLRGNSFATGMVVEHVILPLFWGRKEDQEPETEPPPAVAATKACEANAAAE